MNQTAVDIVSVVRDAGVVGAGGAGFPIHVKLANKVDTYIANGVECEPILEADKYLMITSAPAIVRGLETVMEQVGAQRGIIAIKEKNQEAVDAVNLAVKGKPNLEVAPLGNYYPAGDEQVLIRQLTGRIVPPGGLPFMAGVTVSNVATLKQISDALDGKSVTSRLVTVCGEVSRPVTIEVPVGTLISDLISYVGGATVSDYEVVVGGPIMGTIGSVDAPIAKTMGGVIVLPSDHTMILLKKQPVRITKQRAKMCCTCQECTILCPRNAMGHPIFPGKNMSYSWYIDETLRRIENNELDPFMEQMISEALLCCQCGICEQYACIFGLSPNKVYAMIKNAITKAGLKFDFSNRPLDDKTFEYRKIPALTYARKLGLEPYIVHTDFEPLGSYIPEKVHIPLCQHLGVPAEPVVKAGDIVKTGDLIGEIPSGALGARIHSSIDGRIEKVTDKHIIIGRTG